MTLVKEAWASPDFRKELRETLKLSAPIVINQVGHMSMGLVDTLVAGQLGTDALAGLGLASNFFWTFTSVCLGALLSLDTYFSQAVGANDTAGLSRQLAQSLWSCLLVAVVSGAVILVAHAAYVGTAPPSSVRSAFSAYIRVVTWCLPSLFVFFVLQRYWQARQRVLEFTAIILLANVLNLVACLALGLGKWGFPRLGVPGLAMATVISRYAMLAVAVGFTWRELRDALSRWAAVDWGLQRRFFRLGLPAAAHTGLEIGAFTIATLIVSTLGSVSLAAHHVTLTMAAFTFMFPLGFACAAAVRVGTYIGAGCPGRVRLAGWLCIGLSVAVMSCFALVYLGAPRWLLSAFSQDPAVIETGTRLLFIVALFQIADGIQVSTTGALRGLGDTQSPMVANLIGHYPIGLAAGSLLCFGLGWGVVGLWAGLALGLVSVASLVVRAWLRSTRDLGALHRVDVATETSRL